MEHFKPKQAHEFLQANPDAVLIDVRSEVEFLFVGHPVGAFLGAVIFEFVKLFAAAYLTGAWQMVLGFVLIAMVFFAPQGLSGLMNKRKGEPA